MLTDTPTGSWLHRNKSQAIKFVIVSIGITTVFLLYVWFIGIPKTEARNLYNRAQIFIELHDYISARSLLEDAYAEFPEGYISEALTSLPEE